MQINVNSIRISNVDSGSAVAIGNNYFYDWQNNSKSNYGFGRLNGDQNSLPNSVSGVDDPDWQDTSFIDWLPEQA